MLLSLCYFLYQRLHPRILEIGEHADGSLRSRTIWNLPPIAPHVLALRMDAEWDFASANALERYINDVLQQRSDIRMVYLDAQPINRIDVTGVESFLRLRRSLHKLGICLHIGGLKLPVQAILERAGALVPGPDLLLAHQFAGSPEHAVLPNQQISWKALPALRRLLHFVMFFVLDLVCDGQTYFFITPFAKAPSGRCFYLAG